MMELIWGDCLKIVPTLKGVTALITDPPYGVNIQPEARCGTDKKLHNRYTKFKGDDQKFNPLPFLDYKVVVLFGANFYSDALPIGGWIVWDKTAGTHNQFGPELAWTNIPGVKMIRVLHCGVINADSKHGDNEPRFHPTQKPVALMRRILEIYTRPGDLILDPFMGSGTTGIACKLLNRDFIGIDIEQKYVDIARKRIEGTQIPLFTQEALKRERKGLL